MRIPPSIPKLCLTPSKLLRLAWLFMLLGAVIWPLSLSGGLVQAGAGWRPLSPVLRGKVVWDIALFQAEQGVGLYAGTQEGLYRCLEGSNIPSAFECQKISAIPSTNVYAVSTDGNGGRVIVALDSPKEVRFSQNAGLSWTTVITETFGYTFARRDENVVLLGTVGKGMKQSNSGGQAWFQVQGVPSTGLVPAVVFGPDGTQAWASVIGDGIYAWAEGEQNWSRRNSGLKNVFSLTALDANTVLAGTDDGRIYKSVNAGTNWAMKTTFGSDIPVYALVRRSDAEAYAGTFGQGVWVTQTAGEQWQEVVGLSGNARYVYALRKSIIDRQTACLFAATADGIWVWPNITWIPLHLKR